MIKLTIDHIPLSALPGTTVMEAAAQAGISIPSLCFRPGHTNHPSCMVCLVEEIGKDHLVPSCALPVADGMEIITSSPQVLASRRQALELLLSDHVGDCEAPCRLSCPAGMDIPLMNRLIGKGFFNQALQVVRKEIALPFTLGYICPAPCEKACKRGHIDQPVAICMLKRSTAQWTDVVKNIVQQKIPSKNKNVAIIGMGPAGLSAAFYLQLAGFECTLYDYRDLPGGSLRYSIPEDKLPRQALDSDIGVIRQLGAEFRNGIQVTQELFSGEILPRFDAVLLATGSQGENLPELIGLKRPDTGSFVNPKDFTTSIPGLFGCGNIIREQKMAVYSAAQGRMAATSIEQYLLQGTAGSEPHPYPKSVSAVGRLLRPEFAEYLKESIPDARISPGSGYLSGFTKDEALTEALRCMHCDCRKPVSCRLRNEAVACEISRKQHSASSRNSVTKAVQHDLVVYETEKCIRCGLCVEITHSNGEALGLAYAGRGFDVRINVPFNMTMRESLTSTAKACVEACPTGALAMKNQEERLSP